MPICRHCGFLFRKAYKAPICLPVSAEMGANARAYTRVRRFSFFAFTASPSGYNCLMNKGLSVKVNLLFPSPVKC